jgi:endonuclease/exonuclease/phosphatase (EEP) superfamily protein YafD
VARFGIILTLLLALASCVRIPQDVNLLQSGPGGYSCDVAGNHAAVSGLSAKGFTLTTWNICKGCGHGWVEDLRELASHSDLLLLQEARMEASLKQLLRDSDLSWSLAHAFTLEGTPVGVLTGARAIPLAACAQRITEPLLRVPKTALVSYYALDGSDHSLLVVNMHGVNFVPGSTELARQLHAVQKAVFEHEGPVIVAGDFNTWSARRMAVLRKLAQGAGLQAVVFEGSPSLHFGRQLDHVYYRGLTPQHAWATTLQSSDHYPLSVTFKLDSET